MRFAILLGAVAGLGLACTSSGRTGKTGYGPGGGKEIPLNANAIDDENRPTN